MVLGFATANRPSPATGTLSDVNHFVRSLRVDVDVNVIRRVRLHTQAVVLTCRRIVTLWERRDRRDVHEISFVNNLGNAPSVHAFLTGLKPRVP